MAPDNTRNLDGEVDAGCSLIAANAHHLDLPHLTRQEAEFAATFAATSCAHTAAKRVGISKRMGTAWAERPEIKVHVDALLAKYREAMEQEVTYTLADAHADIEMGKRMSANATEWYRGVELHMRLHGLGEKKQGDVNININNVNSREQLEAVDDDQLMEIAGFSYDDLLPQAVDAEVVDGA